MAMLKTLGIQLAAGALACTLVVGGVIGGVSKMTSSQYNYFGSAKFEGEEYNNGRYTFHIENQNDYGDSYDGGNIADSGCGLTSLAICVSGWVKGENPSTILKHIKQSGLYTTDTTQSHAIFDTWFKEYGLTCDRDWQSIRSSGAQERITEHLKMGYPIVYNVGGGSYSLVDGTSMFVSKCGHYITMLGIDASGNIFLGDPARRCSRICRLEKCC